jgi:hypothetical protein
MKNWRLGAMIACLAAGALLTACRDDPLGPRVVGLECRQPDGSLQECDLILPAEGGFRVELLSTECTVTGNAVRVIKPTIANPVLTADGCVEEPGVLGEFPGSPYPAGTAVSIQIESARAGSTSALRADRIVEGDYPTWLVEFEDGTDNDFNDLVLQIVAFPPAT